MAERSPVEGMRLGVCYNGMSVLGSPVTDDAPADTTCIVFDSEELLEQSVRSIRAAASFVCVVYQTISNFGAPCNPGLETMLTSLVSAGLVDEIVRLEPQSPIDAKTKRAIVSRYATYVSMRINEYRVIDASIGFDWIRLDCLTLIAAEYDVCGSMSCTRTRIKLESNSNGIEYHIENSEIDTGGPAEHIAEQFINETMKREAGRLKCLAAGCTHVMSMDADEFYIHDELVAAMRLILQHGYEATACRMRTYFKEPIYEFFPPDDLNGVPFIFLLRDDLPFKVRDRSNPELAALKLQCLERAAWKAKGLNAVACSVS